MAFIYKRATLADINILTETRIEVLRAANQLSDAIDMSEVQRETFNYYQKALVMAPILPIWFLTVSVLSGPAASVSFK